MTRLTIQNTALFSFMLIGSALSSAADAKNVSPLTIAKQFCTLYSQQQLDSQYHELVTPSLENAIAEAMRRNRELLKKAPHKKSPLSDGIPFQSSSERGSCKVGRLRTIGDNVKITIVYQLDKRSFRRDQLLMTANGEEWKIDEILYAPLYANTMRKHLKTLFEPAVPPAR
ncbi:hypothetical protein [Herbaspirillum rhizosphaerae]|uniref:hypothetical protein n=1 Tax=Herbaspirillum rhizosphaerae TaxID=346179 RepID=UPI00067C4392|nr:hypothetical protein [Herbaspirillum rhizosphaerae]